MPTFGNPTIPHFNDMSLFQYNCIQCKDSTSRRQRKFTFYVEAKSIFCKDSAKFRFSEPNKNLFYYLRA
ncbi:hypothetical protein HMPREF9019_0988 [Hoylesella timonensis CRIS 5C-B1]|uniref:Uncharacterized protein n=1 Tax=Hoylesella timonensis CRIS 5C-B1 TaxID=679189 RepID=D1W0G3_9BACT|nr:hypothetical protein HMPREF9019_0988 [Hoylesella timonensis CRIS 5C-B1]